MAIYPDTKCCTDLCREPFSFDTYNSNCKVAPYSPDIDRSSSERTFSLVHSGYQDTIFGEEDVDLDTPRPDYLGNDPFDFPGPHLFSAALNFGNGP